MAEISKITLLNGTTYDLKDQQARDDIAAIEAAISGGVTFMGETTTALTDGSTVTTITINGTSVTALKGYLVVYQSKEFVFDGTKWIEMGDLSLIGDLGWKDSASGNFTPAGSVSQPTFTGSSSTVTITATDNSNGNYQPKGTVAAPTISLAPAGSTASVVPIDGVGTLPSLTTTVANEVLTIGFHRGSLPTKGTAVTVKTGDGSYTASAPAFTGSKAQLSGTTTASGTVSQPTFTGTQGTVTVT